MLTRETVELHARSQLREPFDIPLQEIVGVVDLVRLVEDDTEEPMWEQAPRVAYIETGRPLTEPDVMVVFKQPLTLPPLTYGGRQNLGVSRADGKALDVDAILLASKEEGGVARALQLAGVPLLYDPMATFRSLWPAVDDPARVEELIAEERAQLRRVRRNLRAGMLASVALGGGAALFRIDPLHIGHLALYLAVLAASAFLLKGRYRRTGGNSLRLLGEAGVVTMVLFAAHVALDQAALWAVAVGWAAAAAFVVIDDGLGLGLPGDD